MLHSIRTVLAHFPGYMTVGIQGELGGCVAQIGLNSFDIVSCIEGGNGETVAQIMKSGIIRDFCPLDDFLEMLYNSSSDKVLSKGISKHKVKMIVPQLAGNLFLRLLFLQFLSKGIQNNGGGKNGAFLAILWGFHEVVTVNTLKLLFDRNNTGCKVNAIPS